MSILILEEPQSDFMIEPEGTFEAGEIPNEENSSRPYARCIAASQRIQGDIDQVVFRGRSLDVGQKFLPDGLSKGYCQFNLMRPHGNGFPLSP